MNGLASRAEILLDQSDAFGVASKLASGRLQRHQVAQSFVLPIKLKEVLLVVHGELQVIHHPVLCVRCFGL